MKCLALFLFAAVAAALGAQTAPKAASASPTPSATKAAATAKPAVSAAAPAIAPWIKLPAGVPKVVHGPVQTPFALRYEDIKVGAGAEGEPNKMWHIKYTGWRAADGLQFDTWENNRRPVIDKDGKAELGPDGKPKMGDPDPMVFPQGMGRTIAGFDHGLTGMKIGGKRRIFIPWQLAYGNRDLPARPAPPSGGPSFPGIPPKSDLIFDVELVDVTDLPTPPVRPGMPGGMPGARPMPIPQHPGAGNQPGTAPSAPTAPAASTPPAGTAPSASPAASPQPAAAAPAPNTAPAAQPAAQPASPQSATPPASTQPN